ncbi:RNA-directed DNA polymerase, eukaryota [Tanacetum coccineum]
MIEGSWITIRNDIKAVFLKFHQEKFSQFEEIKALRRSESYNSLNTQQSSHLEEPVFEVEIKKAIWDCGSNKSPGLDGFTSWIRGCLSSAKAFVLVNGSLTAEFNLQRGLRQGDPLSRFLFILVMEGLHVAIEDAINAGLFYGAKLQSLHVSHFFFMDDVLLLGEWSSVNITNMVNLLNSFHKVSGLKLNLHKSNLFGIRVDPSEVSNSALVTGCQAQCLPFSYLRLLIGSNMARVNIWVPIVNKFHKRFSRWKSSLLSIGGVWARIVKSINSLNEKGIIPFSTLKRKVNDGTGTKFWHDSWICDTPLAIKYPHLFRLEINQDCLVSDKWNGEWNSSWSRPITGGTIGSHLEELQNLVSNVQLGDAIDEWQWNVLNNKMFTVKHTRLHIDQLILSSEAPATRQCKSNPRKVNILVWRILRDRIPS